MISPVTNLLFMPVTTVIIILAFVSAVLCGFGIMPQILINITEILSSYCLSVAEIFGGTDRFVLRTDSALSVGLCFLVPIAVYLVIKAMVLLRRKINKKTKPL